MRMVSLPRCPVCGATDRWRMGRRGRGPIRELALDSTSVTDVWCCRECRHVWCDPIPAREELDRLYSSGADRYFHGQEEAGAFGADDLMRYWNGGPGDLLDVGCGTGRLMAELNDRGWCSVGVEPVSDFAAAAREYGRVVPSLDDVEGQFDVISLIAVLEHVPDPVDLLRRARVRARPGALVVAQVPQAHRLEARLLDRLLRITGRPWTVRTAPMHPPFHLSEFSPQSLATALRRAGWVTTQLIMRPGHNSYPLPAWALGLVRSVERLDALLGSGLEVLAVGRNPGPLAVTREGYA